MDHHIYFVAPTNKRHGDIGDYSLYGQFLPGCVLGVMHYLMPLIHIVKQNKR